MPDDEPVDADSAPLISSPLEDEHVSLGARLVPFSGWSMPVRYPEGTIAEHMAVRDSVGVFDVSHLGSIRVRGDGAADALDALFTNNLAKIGPGRAQYTLLLNRDGGVVDDIIVWWLGEDDFWVVPNAANSEAVFREMARAASDTSVQMDDLSREMAIVAVQGPKWREAMDAAGLTELAVDRFDVIERGPVVAAGTGYTGEGGCELLVEPDAATEIWRSLVSAARELGGGPAGLGARDTLRLEMGYPLHGHEMDATVSPYEAALGWVVSLDKPRFAGRDAIAAGPSAAERVLVGFEMSGREIPRAHCPILLDGEAIGESTSGNMSPVLGHGIGMARVRRGSVSTGDTVGVDIRGREAGATVVRPPFIPR